MREARTPIIIFAVCAFALLGALAFVTRYSLGLERAELEARAAGKHQEALRLALWRMDSAITPIVAREAARPYFHYKPFYPGQRAYTNMLRPIDPSELLVPSPLLRNSEPFINLYYELDASGDVRSPNVPIGPQRAAAESGFTTAYAVRVAEDKLEQVRGFTAFQPTSSSLPIERLHRAFAKVAEADGALEPSAPAVTSSRRLDAPSEFEVRQEVSKRARSFPESQRSAPEAAPSVGTTVAEASSGSTTRDERELSAQSAPVAGARFSDFHDDSRSASEPVLLSETQPQVEHGPFVPRWVVAHAVSAQDADAALVFERDVVLDGERFTQGFWIDWPALRAALLASCADLFPQADLVPAAWQTSGDDARALLLASIPAQIIVPDAQPFPSATWTPARLALLMVWIVALIGLTLAAAAVRTAIDLAERRGRFVSAVTHELRTPLTTFRLYSQMLASGMVKTEDDRRTYAQTLETESTRLAAIVESVLDYARLGVARPGQRRVLTLGQLAQSLRPVLENRCDQAGLTLDMTCASPDIEVHVDPAAVERILFNLVDNACKYAAFPAVGDSSQRAVHVAMSRTGAGLIINVRDHGSGIPNVDQRRLFRPFSRGRAHADGSTPGMGLGLALARGLARQSGGELALAESGPAGSMFSLRLPVSAE